MEYFNCINILNDRRIKEILNKYSFFDVETYKNMFIEKNFSYIPFDSCVMIIRKDDIKLSDYFRYKNKKKSDNVSVDLIDCKMFFIDFYNSKKGIKQPFFFCTNNENFKYDELYILELILNLMRS